MWIELRTLQSTVLKATDEEFEWLYDYLAFDEVEFKGGKRKVHEKSMLKKNGRFPSGFVLDNAKGVGLRSAAQRAGFTLEIVDKRTPPCKPDPSADLAWLRDYQRLAVERVVERTRGILWLPTGAGKTEVAVGLTRALPCRWLALVADKQLVADIADRFRKRTNIEPGLIIDNTWNVPDDAPLTACTFQKLARALKLGLENPTDPKYLRAKKLLDDAQGLIVDECHTLPASSFYKVAMNTPNAYYRVGMSGTPLARGDQKSLYSIAAIGPVVIRIKADLLIKRGVLSKPTVRMVKCVQSSDRATWAGVYTHAITDSTKRNKLLVGITERATKPGLLFVKEIDHGRELTNRLMRAGIKAEFVWGSHSVEHRRSLIRRLVKGHFDMIVCSVVFQQGIDIPELRSVVIGSGGKSVIAALQRLGRGMRVDRDAQGNVREGGDTFEVWDVLDRGQEWTERHANARRNAYTGEGYETFIENEPVADQLRLPTVR